MIWILGLLFLATLAVAFWPQPAAPQASSGEAQALGRLSARWPAALSVLALVGLGAGLFWVSPNSWNPELRESWWYAAEFFGALSVQLNGASYTASVGLSIVALGIAVFAWGYFEDGLDDARYFPAFLAFTIAMLGVLWSDHLLLLFLFWEGTSVISYFLIAHNQQKESARKAALHALIITGTGGLALLISVLLVWNITGVLELSRLSSDPVLLERLQTHPLYWLVGLGFLLAAMTKSAQFPFHSWLPGAMAAPTPVSAYLHSATMVKAGVWLLWLVMPIMSPWPLWTPLLSLIGLLTLLYASIRAWQATDLKQILAQTTTATLGLLVFLASSPDPRWREAFWMVLAAHALYKSSLFMVVGSIDHGTGTRDVRELFGLRKKLPWTFLASLPGTLAFVGLPPSLAFLGKEVALKAASNEPLWVLVVLTASLAVLASSWLSAWWQIFFLSTPTQGRLNQVREAGSVLEAHESGFRVWLPALALGALGLFLGFRNELLDAASRQETVTAVPFYEGFNLPLVLTLLITSMAVALAALRLRLLRLSPAPLSELGVSRPSPGARAFHLGLALVLSMGAWLTKIVFSQQLARDLMAIILIFSGATFLLIAQSINLSEALGPMMRNLSALESPALILPLFMGLGGLALLAFAQGLVLLYLGLAVIGFSTIAFFATLSGPDLALTQSAVEAVSTWVFVLALPLLQRHSPLLPRVTLPRGRLLRDLGLATAAGVAFFVLLLTALRDRVPSRLSDYFWRESVPQGNGANVVNVILVDFRALDTLGEITVLGIAALCIGLLFWTPKPEQGAAKQAVDLQSPILRSWRTLIAAPLFGLAIWLFYRGHNEPGGGFVGGLVLGLGLSTWLVAGGRATGRSPLLSAVGLWVALASGLIGLLMGRGFLEGLWAGGPFGTPVMFDLGVMLLVAGLMSFVTALLLRWTKENPRP
jgi:multicomponent Na+:H+ antiporter subunit A